MTTVEQINQASSDSGKWLRDHQAKHVKMVEESIKKLQDDILASLNILKKDPNGKIRGLSVNLENSQKIHAQINKLFEKDYSKEMQKVISDFKNNEALIKSSFKTIGEAVKFTSVDDTMMKVLRDGNYQQYLSLGKTAQDKVTQQVYNSVIAGESQAQLASTIRASLLGSAAKSAVGVPLANYARLYARDMIMNYHNDVILTKGEALGMDHFKYVGTLMATSRDFCKRRVALTYTKDQIQSWKYKWKGKSGPAWTARGGFNCRHHWQPVRPEWLSEGDQYGIGKFNSVDKKGDIKTPWQKEKDRLKRKPPAPKPAPIPPKTIGKGTIPNAPTLESIQKDLADYKRTPGYLKVKDELKTTSKLVVTGKIKQDKLLADVLPTITKLNKEMIHHSNPSIIYKKMEALKKPFLDKAKEVGLLIYQEQQLSRSLIELEKIRVLKAVKPPAGGIIKFNGENLSSRMKNKVTNNFTKTADLLHPDLIKKIPEQYVRYQSGIRAYYTKGFTSKLDKIKRPGSLHIGSGSLETQTHEFGHAIEAAIPGYEKKARAFLKERAEGQPMSRIYSGTKEMGWSDGFYNHYVGKYYSHGATEITSMGLEQMGRSPMAFLKLDPGHFDFILKVMWGVL